MKKIRYYIGIILAAVFSLTACEQIMDEKKDLSSLTPDDVWSDQGLILRYLDNTMANGNIPVFDIWANTLDDEDAGYTPNFLNNSFSGTPDSPISWWGYANMRNINNFLENIDKVPDEVMSQTDRESYKGQMLVLRAWNYWLGVRAYGGVPLVLEVQEVPDDPKTLGIPRSKTSECIAQIVADLDAAIALNGFPLKWTDDANAGRFSKCIAYTLKAKVLLNYASPRFTHEIGAGTKSAEQRWTEAYNAWSQAKNILDGQGYGLFRGGYDKSFDDAVQDYYDMFIGSGSEMPSNPEIIWAKRYDVTALASPTIWTDAGTMFERSSPTLQLLNLFLNADGTPYTKMDAFMSNLASKTVQGMKIELDECKIPYWQGREPRFYATIVYNGCDFPIKRRNAYKVGDVEDPHHWFFEFAVNPYTDPMWTKAVNVFGIGQRKLCDLAQNYENDNRGTDRPIIRYAEVLLSLAECAAKTGKEAEAIGYLKQLRQRAGIPSANNYGLGSPTGDALILAILNERAVELAYESGNRFQDLLRWRLYTDALNGYTLKGQILYTIGQEMKVFDPINGKDDYAPVLFNFPDINVPGNEAEYYKYFTDRVFGKSITPINVGERQYFWCIPYDAHIVKNPIIEQTKGWDDPRGAGTFDPYL